MPQAAPNFEDAEGYERLMGAASRAVGSVFLEWLDPPAGASWLDVGCGTGAFTRLIFDRCSPRSISAIDPSKPQIEHASRELSGMCANFRVADVQALPFGDAVFDLAASALTINFVPDRTRALSEMCRVVHPGGFVAGYVWDFAEERSPSWPMRAGLREIGVDVPEIPGIESCRLDALASLFARAGLGNVSSTSIEIAVSFVDFDDFWQAQTSSVSPTTKIISGMTGGERTDLIRAVRAALPENSENGIRYSARANAIKGRVPG